MSMYAKDVSVPSTIDVKAAPIVSPMYPQKRLIPINATPSVRPAEKALLGFIPTISPIMNNTIGKNTAAPRSRRPWNTVAYIAINNFPLN